MKIWMRSAFLGMTMGALATSAFAAGPTGPTGPTGKTVTYTINPLVKQGSVQMLGGKSVALKTAGSNNAAQVIFQDLKPGANWAHPALIQVLGKDGTVLESVSTRVPPLRLEDVKKSAQGFVFPDSGPTFKINDFKGKFKVTAPEHFYALLINGSADQRHYNDFAFLTRVLVKVYGYLPKNIYVADSAFITSAASVDADDNVTIQYQSTVQGVSDLITKLQKTITSADQLLIATDDHGDTQDGESTLYLYDGEMKASAFAALVNPIPAGRMLSIHEPCYSGGLVRPTIQTNRAAMAAATDVELSWASMDLNFDEFIQHVIEAFGMQTFDGQPVKADLNGDGKISAREAFAYAIANDQRPESPVAEDEADSGFISTIGIGF